MEERDHGALLDLIYETAVDPGLWSRALEALADLIGGSGAVLIRQNQTTGASNGVVARVDPQASELYRAYYGLLNPLQPLTDAATAVARKFRPVLNDEQSVPKETLVRSEYYNDFMRRFDMHSFAIINLAVVGVDDIAISISRTKGQPQFNGEELSIAAEIRPHLIRAFRLGREVAAAHGDNDDLAALLERAPGALMLLDGAARIAYANAAAEALLGRCDGLTAVCGRLRGVRPEANRRLEALIAQAASPDPARRAVGSLSLGGSERRRPLSVLVAPFRSHRFELFDQGPSVMVSVTDLDAEVSLPERRLREFLGLSPAEARVASALFEGRTPREAAEALGLSFFTVRGHLVRIFEKTQTRGQPELTRLMARFAEPLNGDEVSDAHS